MGGVRAGLAVPGCLDTLRWNTKQLTRRRDNKTRKSEDTKTKKIVKNGKNGLKTRKTTIVIGGDDASLLFVAD